MSLQVWLPLNGDLRNQGLSTLNFTNENISTIMIDNNGKIGKCYKRAAKQTAGRIISDENINLSGDLSMCCWTKVIETPADSANGLITNHSHSDNTGFGITVKQISTDDYRISCSTGNGSGGTYHTYYGTTNIKNTWHHLALTYNSTTHIFQLWVDGKVEKTQSYTNASKADKIIIFDWSTTYNATAYRPACCLNDVRIYDHCLSQKEVKELAKGLAIHYKLDGTGYANQNLLLDTLKDNGNSHTTYNIADYNFSESLVSGQTYTITAKINASPEKIYVGFYHSGGSTSMSGWVPVTTDGLYTKTFTANSTMAGYTAGAGHGYCRVYISNNPSGTQGSYTLAGSANVVWIKIEKGNKSTIPWCFNKSEISQIVLDSSGFNNNGAVSGNLEQSIDSPVYLSSAHFNGSTQVRASKEITTTTDSTICLWVKASLNAACHILDARTSDSAGKQPIYSYTSGSIQTGGYGAYVTSNTGLLEANKWVHLAIVQSGNSILLYKNGLLFQTLSATNAPLIKPVIGGRWSGGTNYTGYLSDFRVYTTALTQEDIQQIVNTGAQIDDSYNLFAREVNEQ